MLRYLIRECLRAPLSTRHFITSTLDASTSVIALLIPGAIGRDAKVIGAAYLPLHANFAPGMSPS